MQSPRTCQGSNGYEVLKRCSDVLRGGCACFIFSDLELFACLSHIRSCRKSILKSWGSVIIEIKLCLLA